MSSIKQNFKHILLMSPVSKRSQGLARALQQFLDEPIFSYINPDVDALPDRLYSWSDIDLMMVDLSMDKVLIYQWYTEMGRRDFMPPVIFLAHPASYSDAGSFYRAGASNYLEFRGLKTSHLVRALTIAEKSLAVYQQAEYREKAPATQKDNDNPFSLKGVLPEEKLPPQPPTSAGNTSSKEPRADFLNTGILNILDRDKLNKLNRE